MKTTGVARGNATKISMWFVFWHITFWTSSCDGGLILLRMFYERVSDECGYVPAMDLQTKKFQNF